MKSKLEVFLFENYLKNYLDEQGSSYDPYDIRVRVDAWIKGEYNPDIDWESYNKELEEIRKG